MQNPRNRFGAALAVVVFAGVLLAAEKTHDKKDAATEEKPTAANELKLTTERAVVFKDGYCLVVKSGFAETNADGEIYTENVPDSAVLGSFWASAKNGRILSMDAGVVTTTEETSKPILCTQYLQILRANRDKDCVIELNDKTKLTGQIGEALIKETETAAPPAVTSRYTSAHSCSALIAHPTVAVSSISGSLFVLKTADGDEVLPVSQIRRITIKGIRVKTQRKEKVTKTAKRLTFRFEKGKQKQEILLMYFTPGMRWIPSYRVDLPTEATKKKEARITLQAELLNEIEDLNDVPVDIVVGVPNFRFRTVISPFSLESTLRNALVQAAPQLMGQLGNRMSNALFTQRRAESRPRRHASRSHGSNGTMQFPPELTAVGAQDLYVYNLPKLKLAKGHRAAVHIFSATVPFRDVYTWDLHLKRHDMEAAPSGSGAVSPLILSKNEVWHQITLVNNTKAPWTTGAAMLTQGHQPLAQELLTYTAPGGSVRVPVTVSVDTRAGFSEKETKRDLKALRWHRCDYARIEKEGKLTLHNLKKMTVPLEIKCRLGGRADQASHEGRITLSPYRAEDWKNYNGHPAVNNHSEVFWNANLEPGKSLELTVNYHYFTRH